jgi:concanavalin A-like lectin/glucanase superfamily protein
MRTVFPRVLGGIGCTALLSLCHCSFLFNLSAFDVGGSEGGEIEAETDGGENAGPGLAADDGGNNDAGDDGRGYGDDVESVTATPAADASADGEDANSTVLDTSPEAILDAAALVSVADATVMSGADAPAPEAAIDSAAAIQSADSAAEVGGANATSDDGGLGAGLVAYYSFAESSGTTSADASGNNQTATMQGATFSPGLQDDSATMNGTNQYVNLPPGIVSDLTSFSVSTWLYLGAAPAPHVHIFDFGTGGGTDYMFLTPKTPGGTPQFAISTGGVATEQVLDGAAPLTVGTWHHLCVTLTGTNGILYIDGVQTAKNAALTLNPSNLGSTTQDWIGRSEFTGDPYLDGKVDQFRIYSRALSAAEVLQLFQEQN